jgi:glutamyl-tRNA reductase
MAVWALGINHTTAPLDLRGRFAFALDQIEPTLQGLRQSLSRHSPNVAAIISTCNRTEIYCAGDHPSSTTPWTGWPTSGGVSPRCCAHMPTRWKTALVARHAFRVASGLDSMVLGEPQILGQTEGRCARGR